MPTVIGIVGFMMIPYIDRNPSTRPSDRKLAIMLFTIFLAGSATLTILGVLFRDRDSTLPIRGWTGCFSTTSKTGSTSVATDGR